MYSYLKGIVSEIKANYITLEVGQIGYQILTPNPYSFSHLQEITLYVYQKVSEDEITLYGFKTPEAKELFLKLISVSGIGPKSAKAILAAGTVESIAQAIESGNASYLQKFPGIGPKASQQIILDLKGKIEFDSLPEMNTNLIEVEEALGALGYSSKEIKKVISKLDSSRTINELVKDALKLMLK